MIVQPASLGPSGKPRRVLRVVGLVVPVLLLGGVVAAGVLGPSPAPAPPSTAPVVAVASPAATPSLSSPQPASAAVVFPSTIAGLDVHGVQYTLEARNRGIARGLVAVAGYLGLDCDPRHLRRRATRDLRPVLRADRRARRGSLVRRHAQRSPDAPGFHLHPQFPVGVRMPSQATNVALSPSTATPPVVVLGPVQRPAGEAVRAGWSPLRAGAGRRARRLGRRHDIRHDADARPARRPPRRLDRLAPRATQRRRRGTWHPARTRCSRRSSIRRRSR